MGYDWDSCPASVKKWINHLEAGIRHARQVEIVGIYLHGSLAMGGFHPKHSDVDLLVVIASPLGVEDKRRLTSLFLSISNEPYPVEITFLHMRQLENWSHPCPYEFHYSEYWRERLEQDLQHHTNLYLHTDIKTDPDLAAHMMIVNQSGICLSGLPIADVFPNIPQSDYIASIMGDFQECLEQMTVNPIYCVLNTLRVYSFLLEGSILSKLETGKWGIDILPEIYHSTVHTVVNAYTDGEPCKNISHTELVTYKNYISNKVQSLLCT